MSEETAFFDSYLATLAGMMGQRRFKEEYVAVAQERKANRPSRINKILAHEGIVRMLMMMQRFREHFTPIGYRSSTWASSKIKTHAGLLTHVFLMEVDRLKALYAKDTFETIECINTQYITVSSPLSTQAQKDNARAHLDRIAKAFLEPQTPLTDEEFHRLVTSELLDELDHAFVTAYKDCDEKDLGLSCDVQQIALKNYRDAVIGIFYGKFDGDINTDEGKLRLQGILGRVYFTLAYHHSGALPLPFMTHSVLKAVERYMETVNEAIREISRWFEPLLDYGFLTRSHILDDASFAMFTVIATNEALSRTGGLKRDRNGDLVSNSCYFSSVHPDFVEWPTGRPLKACQAVVHLIWSHRHDILTALNYALHKPNVSQHVRRVCLQEDIQHIQHILLDDGEGTPLPPVLSVLGNDLQRTYDALLDLARIIRKQHRRIPVEQSTLVKRIISCTSFPWRRGRSYAERQVAPAVRATILEAAYVKVYRHLVLTPEILEFRDKLSTTIAEVVGWDSDTGFWPWVDFLTQPSEDAIPVPGFTAQHIHQMRRETGVDLDLVEKYQRIQRIIDSIESDGLCTTAVSGKTVVRRKMADLVSEVVSDMVDSAKAESSAETDAPWLFRQAEVERP
ncbi:hypothetical protein CERSUDRAFT_97226 [Gelatoporia subvermispora B]|uniref:Uncharacterized protein n=1 Tax=Ceriporiopsis subvermispora (strain B) TaxID=914234 RepID=M2QR26_CERS8|nr:hypothetical protein CERSUDRAFT_97226 [Gelatoporia subvermispora B]